MKMCRIYIPLYEWNVTAFFDATAEDEAVIVDELKYIQCPEHTLARVEMNREGTSWIPALHIRTGSCESR